MKSLQLLLTRTMIKNKENYFKILRQIKSNYERNWRPRSCPYDFINMDIRALLTPIEYNVWCDIRYIGVPFYPQWPVGKYFIDFADPIKKIGIEVDGKIHNKEKTKMNDGIRTSYLSENGWCIYRIPGWKTYKKYEDFFNDEQDYNLSESERDEKLDEYYKESSEGFIRKLKNDCYRDYGLMCFVTEGNGRLKRIG
jgi:very-short-patch-repair endonuclease